MKVFLTIAALFLAGFSITVSAQSGDKFGDDKEACGRNYTIYYELYKNKDYTEAIPFWQNTIEICPALSLSLWKNGEKMYKSKIQNTPESQKREVLIDSLLWIYDQRILFFGDNPKAGTGYVLGRKGLALTKFRKSEAHQAYNYLSESLKIEGDNSKPDAVLTFMKISRYLYSEGILGSEEVLGDYEACMKIIENALTKNPNDKTFLLVKESVEINFTKSGAADCNVLISIYSKQFEENQDNAEWLSKTTRQLRITGCTDNEFFLGLSLAQFELDPVGKDAHILGQKYIKSGNYPEAVSFLSKSIDLGIDDNEKAQIYYELAYIHFSHMTEYERARNYARKAIEIRPDWGEPYLLIGRIYIDARSSAFPDKFDQTTV
ncbi:MAG: hypothetical protein U9N86_18655, partial [Bacteroidota bacterium]|nr:hypothetical protein [Bacteroidota bacterium]